MIFIGQDGDARFTSQLRDFLVKVRDIGVTGLVLIEQLRCSARGERGGGPLAVVARMHLPRHNIYPQQWRRMMNFVDKQDPDVVIERLQQVGRGEPVSLFE